MKRLVWGLMALGGTVTVLVALGGSPAPTAQTDAATVSTIRVERRVVEHVVTATGVIEPMIGAEVKVGSRASGVVSRLHVRIGDRVEKGQLLAELDDRELTARCNQATAAVDAAAARLAYAEAELRRKRGLWDSAVIAAADLDLAERAFAVAREEHSEAEAALIWAQTQLSYARIVAPIDGIVSSVSTQEGETVSASLSAPTFVTLIDLDRLEVRAYVDETDIGRIRLGQGATFTVDTYGDEAFTGRVTAVYPQAEIRDNVVNYITVVDFRTPAGRVLRPEMTTTVKITVHRRADVLAVPRRAVRHDRGETLVYCVEDGVAVARPVTLGLGDDGYWEITGGLHEDEAVVIGPVEAGTPISS